MGRASRFLLDRFTLVFSDNDRQRISSLLNCVIIPAFSRSIFPPIPRTPVTPPLYDLDITTKATWEATIKITATRALQPLLFVLFTTRRKIIKPCITRSVAMFAFYFFGYHLKGSYTLCPLSSSLSIGSILYSTIVLIESKKNIPQLGSVYSQVIAAFHLFPLSTHCPSFFFHSESQQNHPFTSSPPPPSRPPSSP